VTTLDRQIAELYALPLEDFTAARNALAAKLKADDPEGARRVRARKKPNLPAWVLNQVARTNREEIEEFLRVGKRLEKAESEAIAGGGAAAMRRAAAEERQAVEAVVHRADWIGRKAGVNVTPALALKLGDTLRAAVVDAEAREALLAGTLVTDLQRVGFGEAALGARPATPSKRVQEREHAAKRDTEQEKSAQQRERRERDRESAARLEAEAERAWSEVRRVERELKHAERDAERDARTAERTAREAKEAAGRARDSKKAAEALRKQLRAAEAEAERASRRVDRSG
jgi:DNA repair exonuclease SbcCD ATPase subunit